MRAAARGEAAEALVTGARTLRDAVGRLRFAAPVAHVYNPLEYAWAAHEIYLRRYGAGRKRVIFLGMNPGPFGMVQTGIPFGEIAAVRDWLGIGTAIAQPSQQHPKRMITGFACTRSEVSGRRLWGLFAERFGTAKKFFADHFVLNYCPLAFLEASGANRTPNKLPPRGRAKLFQLCDEHLRAVAMTLAPDWIIGVGGFAEDRACEAIGDGAIKVGRVLHPSPASPAANRGWAAAASAELERLGIWN
ncbi:MAG: uracil-DNA glycosylase family protein [Chthoniobacterales bacterium]